MNGLIYTLSVTSPIFILIGLGFSATRLGLINKEGIRSLAWFVMNLGLPAAIYSALSSRALGEILHYDYLVIYGAGSLLAFSLVFSIARLKGKSLTEASIFGLGSSLPNTLMIGYAVLLQLFGTAALLPFALSLMVENILIIPLSLALADIGAQKESRLGKAILLSLKQLTTNPLLIAICLGILTATINLEPPVFVISVIDMLAATVGGIALFSVGGMLVGMQSAGMLKDLSIVVIGKLVLHPACILLLIFLMPPMQPLFQAVVIILASMPMFGIYAVVGSRYSMGEFCSTAQLVTILLSFITISLAIWYVGPL